MCDALCSFSLPLMLSHEDNVPQCSRQQLTVFGSRFNFPYILDHLQRPKTVCRAPANLRRQFPKQAACHGVAGHLDFVGSFDYLSRSEFFFEFRFMILDRFYSSKHSLVPNIFCCAIYGSKIWICMKLESMGGIFISEFLHVEKQYSVENSRNVLKSSLSSWICKFCTTMTQSDSLMSES